MTSWERFPWNQVDTLPQTLKLGTTGKLAPADDPTGTVFCSSVFPAFPVD